MSDMSAALIPSPVELSVVVPCYNEEESLPRLVEVLTEQLSALTPRTQLVTLTVGGNDLGFATVATTCAPGPSVACQAAINGRYGQKNLPPDSLVPNIKDGVNYPLGKQRPATGFDVTSGYAGSASERSVVQSVAAPALGIRASDVPDVAALLFAPLARGSEVSIR